MNRSESYDSSHGMNIKNEKENSKKQADKN